MPMPMEPPFTSVDLNVILLFSSVTLVIFISALLIFTSRRTTSNNLIVLWLFLLGLPLFTKITGPDLLNMNIPILREWLPFGLTFGPILWVYTGEITGRIHWTYWQFMHVLPFILASMLKVILTSSATDNVVVRLDNSLEGNLFAIAILTSSVGYSVMTLRILYIHKQEILNHFSSLSNQISLKWLQWLTVTFLFTSILPIIHMLFNIPELLSTRSFSLFLFILVLGLFSLKQSQVFYTQSLGEHEYQCRQFSSDLGGRENDELAKKIQLNASIVQIENLSSEPIIRQLEQKDKYRHSGLTRESAQSYLQRLEHYMQTEKGYLDANITIEKVSQQLNIPRHYLTQVISEQLNKNFYLFINEYRINSVKQLIEDPKNSRMTLLDMAYESGFNTKSTFNTAFKKITQMTPSQYRKSQ